MTPEQVYAKCCELAGTTPGEARDALANRIGGPAGQKYATARSATAAVLHEKYDMLWSDIANVLLPGALQSTPRHAYRAKREHPDVLAIVQHFGITEVPTMKKRPDHSSPDQWHLNVIDNPYGTEVA